MKKYSKILKISGILFLVGVVIVMITVSIAGGVYSFSINSNGLNLYHSAISSTNLDNFNSVVVGEFDSVSIVSVSDEINFIPSNEFRVEYSLDDRFNVTKCEVKGKTLVFEYNMPNQLFGFNPSVTSGYINIYYDQSINNGEFDDINIHSVKSDVDFSKINSVGKIKIDCISNDIKIDVDFEDLAIHTISSDIDVINLGENVKRISITTISSDANVTLKDDNVEILVETVSGKSYQNGQSFKEQYIGLDGKVHISVTSVSGDFEFKGISKN